MKRTNFVKQVLLLIFMIVPVFSYGQSAEEYKSKIEALNKEMVKFMLEGNTEKTLGLYAKDAISLPNYEPMLEGIDAIRKASEDMTKAGVKVTRFEPTTVKVIPNGNLITEIGKFNITINIPGMDQPVNDTGKYLNFPKRLH